jgi:hypothetical protein
MTLSFIDKWKEAAVRPSQVGISQLLERTAASFNKIR